MRSDQKVLVRALKGEKLERPPVWLMRQAGRYLPEYRATRTKAGSFLDLCFNPELAIEVTLQPIRRFGFDASILFSDILVLPLAMGQKVWFEEGKGPCLDPLNDRDDFSRLSAEAIHEKLDPVYETVRGLRQELPDETTLIGFAGAPWTVASYMIEGGTSRDFQKGKTWAFKDPDSFQNLIDLLVDATSSYLIKQVENGAEVLQLFDSWAGVWPEEQLRRWCLEPAKEIVARVKKAYPETPIILFPRGAGILYQDFAKECGADGLGIDTTLPLIWARDNLQDKATLQGNLDPILLLAGGTKLREHTKKILDTLGERPFMFNLGHGILPQTPIAHVEELMELIRK